MDKRELIAKWLEYAGLQGDHAALADNLLAQLHQQGFIVVRRGSESPVIAPPAGYVNGRPT